MSLRRGSAVSVVVVIGLCAAGCASATSVSKPGPFSITSSTSASSIPATPATSTTHPNADGVGGLVVNDAPPGFAVVAAFSHTVDLADTNSDLSDADRSALQGDGFTHGYQRTWHRPNHNEELDVRVWQFDAAAGATKYESYLVEDLASAPEGRASFVGIPGVPGGRRMTKTSGMFHFDIAYLTRGNFCAEVVDIVETAGYSPTLVPSLAVREYSRLR